MTNYTSNFKSNYTPNGTQAQQSAVPALQQLNNPYQLNTILDVLFNTAGLKKTYGNASLTSRIKAIRDITLNQYVKPALKGDFSTVGINTLMGFSEVTDVFGNLFKGLLAPVIDHTASLDYNYAKQAVDLIDSKQAYVNEQARGPTMYTFYINGQAHALTEKELDMYRNLVNSGNTVNISKLTTGERFKASIGIGEYGRINFQSNQGNTFVDIATELLLDPETWFGLGKGAISSVVKGGSDKGLSVLAKHLDDITLNVEDLAMREELRQLSVYLTDDAARELLASKITKIYRKGTASALQTDAYTNKLFKDYIGDVVKSDSIFNTYKIKTVQDAVNASLIASGQPAAALNEQIVQEAIQRSMTKHVNKMTTTVLSALDVGSKIIDKTQSVLLKSALTPTGVFPVWAIAKKTPSVAKFVKNTIQSSEELYKGPNGCRRITSFFDGAYNKERNTQVVTDMLSDDLKVLYREPSYIRKFEEAAVADMAYIDNWYRNLNDRDYVKQIEDLNNYIKTQQLTDLDGLIEYVDNIVKNSAETSTIIKRYRDTLYRINEDVTYLTEYAERVQKVKAYNTALRALNLPEIKERTYGVVSAYINVPDRAIISDVKDTLFNFMVECKKTIYAHGSVHIADLLDTLESIKQNTIDRVWAVCTELIQLDPNMANVCFKALSELQELLDKQTESFLFEFHSAALYNKRTTLLNTLEAEIKYAEKPNQDMFAEEVQQALETYGKSKRVKNSIQNVLYVLNKSKEVSVKNKNQPLINNLIKDFRLVEGADTKIDYNAEIYALKDFDTFKDTAFSADALNEFIEDYTDLMKPVNDAITFRVSALNLQDAYKRPATILDGIQQIKQANAARQNAIIKKLDMAGTKKSKVPGMSEAELEKVRAAQKKMSELAMPASRLPKGMEQADDALDALQRLTSDSRYDKLELFVRTADEYFYTAPGDINADKKVMQYSYDAFEDKVTHLMVTSALDADYVEAYNEVTKTLNNAITTLHRRFGDRKTQQLSADLLKDVYTQGSTVHAKGTVFYTIPGVGSAEGKAWWQLSEDETIEAYRVYHNRLLAQGMSAQEASDTLAKEYSQVNMPNPTQVNEAVFKEIDIIENFLNDLQEYCAPSKIGATKELIESYEATFRIKQESFTSLLNILNDDSVNQVVDSVRTGPLSKLITDVTGNNLYSEEIQEAAKAVKAIVNSFESTRNFVYRVLLADIRPEVREALLASAMNYWWLTPESFKDHQAFWANLIVERMPNFTQFTQQGMRRHNLNKLMQEEEFKEAIKKVYDAADEAMPDTELHQALADAIASAGVLSKLAEQNRDIANAIKDKVVIHIDSEAMNATTKAMTNQMHQIGYLLTKDDTVLHKYSQAIVPEAIMGESGYDFMPENSYMLGLWDMAQHKTDGTYAPVSDYTQVSAENMREFYFKHLSEGNTAEAAASADNLLLDSLYNLYKQLEQHAEFNPDTKTFNAVIDGHNIKGFDLPYIKDICSKHKLYERAANEKEYGFDLHFIDNLEVIDTLEQVKIEDFSYALTGAENATVRKLLFEYADSLDGNSYAKLFTAFNTADIRRIKNLIQTVEKNPGKAINPSVEGMQIIAPNEFTDLLQQLAKAKETVIDIYKNNHELASQSFYASVVTGENYREYWLKFFKNELNLDEDEITRRFGKDASNLQLSSLFAAAGEYSDYAFKPELQPQKQDAWWIGSLTRTQAGDFTREEAVTQAKITAALNTYQKEAKNYEVYASYHNEMYHAVQAILGTGDFKHMRYIRTEGLNTSEQYALFRYLSGKVNPDQLKEVLMQNMTDKQADRLIALLQIGRKFSDVSDDPYLNLFNTTEDKKTLAYIAMLDDNMALRKKFEAMSQLQDNNGLVGSAATLQIKAMEPLHNMLFNLTENLKGIGPVDDVVASLKRVKFYNAEMDLTNALGRQITKRFTDATPEDTLKWLAHNHAHVVLDMYSFKNLEEYNLFLDKLNSKEFAKLNIHSVVDGAMVWVYLPKSANLRMHKNLKTGEKFVNVNGQNIDNYAHAAFKAIDMAETYNGFVDTNLLQKAMDAIDFMTEGACRGSTYEMYGQNTFRKLYNKMPEAMQKEFYTVEELSSPLFWDSTPYNYSILGTLTNKRNLGIGTSGQFISSLRNATQYRMNEHGMRLVYTQSMFSDANALQNTEIGKIIAEHTDDALRYFNDNPDYTIAVLVPDKHSKWGYRVKECDVHSKAGLRNALANNGKVVSYSEFEKLYEVINTNTISETKLAAWQKIVRMFKIGYLVNPGTWARNSIDAFMKNVQTTDSDMFTSYATAFKDIKDYDEIVRQLNGLGNGHFPLPGVVKRYFDGKDVKMDYDKFTKLHAFFSDPAAGSEAKLYTDLNRASREKYLTQLMEANQITTDEYNHQMARSTYNHITNGLLAPMNGIERVSRLACYQQLTKQGFTSNSALRMVEKTHFAYSTKSKSEQIMELLIPFYTFTSRNFTYWMDAMENNPAYFAIMRDMLEPALNLEQYSQAELEDNASVQRNILSGNINVIDDYYWSLNLSFMDSLKWLSNPLGQAKGQIFSPVQAVVNVYLQHASDEAYHSGKAAISSWLEESFGLDMTEQQIRDKYQAWADEYMKLYSWKVSSEDPVAELTKWKTIEQFIPLIGSQIQRMETTGVYLNDGDGLKAMLYLTGIAGKTTRWAPAPSQETRDLNSMLYNLLSADEGGWNKYKQLCRVLGYEGDKISELPNPVKQTIYAMLTEQVPDYNVLPVLQDSSSMNFMWTALKTKYDVSGVTFADIPKDKLQSMYKEIAESTVAIANIYDMLDQDELSRISYSVVKKNLGLTGLKIYQMPIEALSVMEAAMKAHLYASVRSPQTSSSSYRRYAKKTYTGAESPGYFAGYNGVTPYDTTKGVYANYGQNWAQKQGQHNYLDFYRDMYGANGTNKMQMNLYKISPQNFKYRMKDMFYYYR